MAGNRSSQQVTINEIKKLIEEDNIEIEAALRLTLTSQLIVTEELTGIMDQLDLMEKTVGELHKCGESKLGEIERHLEKYPSISWYWMHKRKLLFLLVLGFMITYTVLFGWVNISDIRQVILSQLGLPPGLGLHP